MTPQFNGEKASRFWSIRQKTIAFTKSLFAKSTRATAKSFGKNLGVGTGAVAAGLWLYSNVAFFGVPSLLLGAGLLVGGIAGWKARSAAKGLASSSVYKEHMNRAATRWVEKKTRPKLVVRLKNALTRVGTALGFTTGAAGVAVGTAAGLQLGGVIALPVLTAVAATVSLPVVIGVAAVAALAGTIFGIRGVNAIRAQGGSKPLVKKPAIEASNSNTSSFSVKPVSNTFQQKSQPNTVSDERAKIAAERRKNGPKR